MLDAIVFKQLRHLSNFVGNRFYTQEVGNISSMDYIVVHLRFWKLVVFCCYIDVNLLCVGISFPYTGGALAAEIILVFILAGLEACRLFLG